MILVNKSHKLLKSVLGLQSLLFGLSMLFCLFLKDLLLGLETLLHLVLLYLSCNQVRLHPTNHMNVSSLVHELNAMVLFNRLERLLSHGHAIRHSRITVLDSAFLELCHLKLFFLELKLS